MQRDGGAMRRAMPPRQVKQYAAKIIPMTLTFRERDKRGCKMQARNQRSGKPAQINHGAGSNGQAARRLPRQ
jgi:hypothetical protein